MPSYKRPGVYAEETLNPSAAILEPNSGVAAMLDAFGRGPTTPTLIESWTQFLNLFGGFTGPTNYLPYAVHQFFSNGGRHLWVTRILGAGATLATRTLNDRAGVPLPTLRVDALNEGAWANTIYIDITDSGASRFNVIVRYGGTTDPYVVERWTDLSMDPADGRYAPTLINSILSGSTYIKVTDLNSVSVAPTDRPFVQAGTALAGGTDGAVPTVAQQQAAITLLDAVDGPLTIAMPGVIDPAVLTTLTSYVDGRGDSFAVVDTDQNLTPAAAIAAAAALVADNAAVYYPWIWVADPAASSANSLRKLPPSGAVLGQYSHTETLRGIQKAPAGLGTRLAGALGVETKLTNTDRDNLNVANVNAIIQQPGAGITIWGARTVSANASSRYVPTRRTLNYIKKALIDGTKWAVFEPNDTTLWSGIETRIETFLLRMWQQGALRGASAAEAFYVKCDAENNPPPSIAAGQVNIEVGLALQSPAEFIVIRIGQWQGGSSATLAA